MNEFDTPGYAEYTYAKRAEGGLRLARALLVAGYVAFVALYFLICYASRVIPIFALAPLFLWMLVYFTWHRVSYDCYVELGGGKITLGRVKRSKRTTKRVAEIEISIKEATLITPAASYSDKAPQGARVLDLSSRSDSPRRVAVELRQGDRLTVAYFDTTSKINRLLSHYPAASSELARMKIE